MIFCERYKEIKKIKEKFKLYPVKRTLEKKPITSTSFNY